MATLVFSTIGTILGGPVGGAIGALLGQSIDEQILGPGSRGPKLGDLNVQTSSYGTQIPRIYGRMRVAGSVIWSTDLVQSEQTSGAKGQPGVTYSYAVSFAVALSARNVLSIGRIWADGKLLRGAEGDFKVPTQFRFYDGSEDQVVDPLIASVEGIDRTPAYRGLALAVFEGLELAEYGNRIPFLTFEVIADDAPPEMGMILGDCSGDAVATENAATIDGYAAYGGSVRAAIEPLIETFAIRLFDDGERLRDPIGPAAADVGAEELGFAIDGEREARTKREIVPESELPAVLRLGFYDPERDYQAGEARAQVGDHSGRDGRRELPAVLSASQAKSLAQQLLGRSWAQRDRLTISLPPGRLAIEPGSVLRLPVAPESWMVDKVTIEGFIARAECRPWVEPAPMLVAADSGGMSPTADVVASETVVALVDAPSFESQASDAPVLYLAASSASPGWSARTVEVGWGGTTTAIATARRKSVIGSAVGALGAAGPHLLDARHSIDVELVDPDQWLSSCDDVALANGANLALLGGELIQFGAAEPLAEGVFRLSRLLRGRIGTEQQALGHVAGERFVLIERDTLVPVPLPAFALGSTLTAQPRFGNSVGSIVSSASLRPPAPVELSARGDGSGGISVQWTRRSRKGWTWLDEVDAPIGEASEAYRVTVTSAVGAVERTSAQPSIDLGAADLAPLGSGPWTIAVRQLGDHAASLPATIQYL